MHVADYSRYDGLGLAELVKTRQVSAKELVEDACELSNRLNPGLNAIVQTRFERALDEAREMKDLSKPFSGVPTLMKDLSQAIAGERITAGTRVLKDRVALMDSHFVAKIRDAGFLIAGQTSSPEFGLKNITEPVLYGPARNPWNPAHSPGGSSGGASAAVAAGIVPIAGASDGGGSIRIPASFTGLVGLKPTRGRTPVGPGAGRQWHGAAGDFVLTKTVRDSAAMLDALQVLQPEAAFNVPLFEGSYLTDALGHKRKFRIAYSVQSPVGTPVSADAAHAVHKTVKWLEEQGHLIEEKAPEIDGIRLMENYYIMNCGEMAADIQSIEESIGRKVTSDDIEIVSWVLKTAGEQVSAIQFTRSIAEWDVAAAQMAHFNRTYDLYITPATAYTAPRVGELTHTAKEAEELLHIEEASPAEQQKMVYDMFLPSLTYTPFTQWANIIGQPAISLPIHLADDGLPIGVQIMAPKGREDWLLGIASQMEQSPIWVGLKGLQLDN
jgi:amidase